MHILPAHSAPYQPWPAPKAYVGEYAEVDPARQYIFDNRTQPKLSSQLRTSESDRTGNGPLNRLHIRLGRPARVLPSMYLEMVRLLNAGSVLWKGEIENTRHRPGKTLRLLQRPTPRTANEYSRKVAVGRASTCAIHSE